MRITVRLAEPYWQAVGKRNLEMDLVEGARLADLLALLSRQYPALSKELTETYLIAFVGDSPVDPETALADGNRVHLVWPIGGG
jgi:molybdopterin converting factor small subunit